MFQFKRVITITFLRHNLVKFKIFFTSLARLRDFSIEMQRYDVPIFGLEGQTM